MKAAVNETYGPAEIIEIKEVARPEIGDEQVLVQVYAAPVTTADWRLRASAFPGGLWLVGRLMMGLFAPRNKVLGVAFSGRVVSVGEKVTGLRMGDAVFGFSGSGAHAEYVAIDADKAITAKPENLGYAEAASLPFGAACALVFLRDIARIEPGWKVLVAGASGGVGSYAVQLARHFGAEVTAITSTGNIDMVRDLGANHVIDYTRDDYAQGSAQYDLIFDAAGVTRYGQAKRVLKKNGIYLPLEFGVKTMFQAVWARYVDHKRILLSVSGDSKSDLEILAGLVNAGALRGVIDQRFAFADIVAAHQRVETRHARGTVVVTMTPETA